MIRSGLFAYLAFVVALAAVVTFEYAIAQTVVVTLCGSAGPYAHANPCPKPSATVITLIPFSFAIAVIAGLTSAVRLTAAWTFVIWVALCVPSGALLGILGHMVPHGFAFYAVGLMLIVMGIGPAFNRTKAGDSV